MSIFRVMELNLGTRIRNILCLRINADLRRQHFERWRPRAEVTTLRRHSGHPGLFPVYYLQLSKILTNVTYIMYCLIDWDHA